MKGLDRLNQVCYAVCLYGLHSDPFDLTESERAEVRRQMVGMLKDQDGVSTKELVEAIRFGMQEVWPFMERGFFDARDVRSNIVKAKAATARRRRRGEIPMTIEEVRAQRAMHEEDDE